MTPDTRTTESPHSLHDPQHAYWCAVPWCPQYVRNHIPAEAAQGAAPRAEGLREALEQIAECDSPECGDDHHAIARSALERRDKEGTE